MNQPFEAIISALTLPQPGHDQPLTLNLSAHFDPSAREDAGIARSLNAAFLITLAGPGHPQLEEANRFLRERADSEKWGEAARFYLAGVERIKQEIEAVGQHNPDFTRRLTALAERLAHSDEPQNPELVSEETWSLFFPEATGLRHNTAAKVEALRAKRTVTVEHLAANPITDPARQILFTSNVLLTVPSTSKPLDELPFSTDLKEIIASSTRERQLYWYDHPIQIGVEPAANEILYGLRNLDAALDFERGRGNLSEGQKLKNILSVSVTHKGLQAVAKKYLEEELVREGGLKNQDIYAFTEADTRRLIDEVLVPAAEHYGLGQGAAGLLEVLGVDGEYGRHYSFLKAILALWNGLLDPEVKATFKYDLDQVFAQKELVEQAGASALEHFKTPLWGASGLDSDGQTVELGMIAGALVNEKDISKGLFTPDVTIPTRPLVPDEYIFFSTLPQAVSTQAEMMTRYGTGEIDGETKCLQRIHVTGGTNGILAEALQRYRPFTPSFIGRAEDQAYLLSTFPTDGPRLAYVHKDGLIMRHDKEAFAQEAIQAAAIGKTTGDYIRILYFSAYARALAGEISVVKERIDPFTGCFVSAIPTTVAYLRFGLKAAGFFENGKAEQALEFVSMGTQRLEAALSFVEGSDSPLKRQYQKERRGWNLYYDLLAALEKGLAEGDAFAHQIAEKARQVVDGCFIHF